ncbi:MAG: hypothetical protein JNK04_06465 [Myxococcales bacterium]|nr:hypothetical protein [Myxococcales bacterium]
MRCILFAAVPSIALFASCADDRTQSSGGAGNGAAAAGGATGAGTAGGAGGADGEGGFVPIDPPTCVDTATLPSWRQGLAAGEWVALPSADLRQVTPDVMPGGGYYGRIDAWNGFAADVVQSVLYLGAAGGHADYAGNEVYTLALAQDAPAWVIETQPSAAELYTIDEPYYLDGLPSSMHTYYSMWFIEPRGRLFRFPGGSTWGSGNGNTPHIDAWDPGTRTWDPAGSHPDMGGSPTYETPTAKDLLTGDVYQVQGDNRLWVWRAETDTTSDLGDVAMGSGSFYDVYASPAVVAQSRLLFLVDDANPGSARAYDLTSGAWSVQALSGSAAQAVASDQAMAFYDGCAEAVVVKTNIGGDLYLVDAITLEATPFPTSGDLPSDAINGVHTLFQYLPNLGGYAYQPRHDSVMYFVATQ